MTDVIADAWPWLIPAFLIGLLCGWWVTLAWCRDHHPREGRAVAPAVEKPARAPAKVHLDVVAGSKVLGVKVTPDDLELIEGIGPRIADLLKVDGINTWGKLGATTPDHLRKILDDAGFRYNLAEPGTWPKQARLLAAGRWADFKSLTDKLVGGR